MARKRKRSDAFIEGSPGLLKAVKRLNKNMRRKIAGPVIKQVGGEVGKIAQKDAAKDFGLDGIGGLIKIRKLSVTKRFVQQKTTVKSPYAFVLEYGTKRGTKVAKKIGVRLARPFMFEYIDDKKKRVLNDVVVGVGKAMKKDFRK